MVGRGYHIALSREHAKRLFGQKDDENLRKFLDELIADPGMKKSGRLFDSGVHWDPLHRCLTEGELDSLQPRSSTVFTSVGYGVQRINPVFLTAEKVRMFAQPHLIQIDTGFTGDFSLLLSNNASTGGTCFGDSGGPNYLGTSNVVAGVTSFGLNGSCGGTGGVFRLDKGDVLDFVKSFLR